MARSAATESAYLHFMRAPPHGGAAVVSPVAAADEDFDESDIWGLFAPIAEPPPPRARQQHHLDARKAAAAAAPAAKAAPAAADGGGRPAHGSLPVKIPDWSKILGHAYRPAGDWWEVDDDEDSVDAAARVPPHELVWRRRAASLSLSSLNYGIVGRTLKVRDAVWMRTTGFQD